MSEREEYLAGVPCWVETLQPDPRSLRGQVIAPPLDMPGFRNAVLADPQGAVFSISQLTAGP